MRNILLLFSLLNLGMMFQGEIIPLDYDEVLHFRYLTENKNIYEDPQIPKWLFNPLPNELNKNLAGDLFKLGYLRNNISRKKFNELNSIFTSKPVSINSTTTCIPVYRDILIFRKKKGKEVNFIAQICFECRKYHFIGSQNDDRFFGKNGEFKKLEKLLYNK